MTKKTHKNKKKSHLITAMGVLREQERIWSARGMKKKDMEKRVTQVRGTKRQEKWSDKGKLWERRGYFKRWLSGRWESWKKNFQEQAASWDVKRWWVIRRGRYCRKYDRVRVRERNIKYILSFRCYICTSLNRNGDLSIRRKVQIYYNPLQLAVRTHPLV